MAMDPPNNSRECGSRITDTRILRKGDALELWGKKFLASIAILDSHDPIAETPSRLRTPRLLPNHHHILMRLEDEDEVLSSGLYVRSGSARDLYFGHITRLQIMDGTYGPKLDRIHALAQAGFDGLFFMSDNEQLSALPQARQYLDVDGGLLR